ncbi:MAG: N-acetylglucosamine-6-phosphate deacetylase [Clostridia bacterium]|nr:N-acetylglucosamine-6-phosphate deacetylase [Clostridia bacterium]
MKCIINGKIITENGVLENKAIVFDKKIIDICENQGIPKNAEIIDAKGNFVCPGFISIHIHGVNGCDTEDGNVDDLNKMSNYLLTTGVTSWCPSLATVEENRIEKILNAVREAKGQNNGAKIIGLHLEGIFLSKVKRGAHREDWLQLPKAELVINNKDIIKLTICAPELDGAIDFIKAVTKEGVRVALGHSNATYEQTKAGINAGATDTTHLFNATSPLSHREPGLPGAVLTDDRIYTELICDKFHIHPALYDMVYNLKKDKLILITDSIRPAGMPDGVYEQGGFTVTKKGVECKLPDGTIAGSVIDLNTGINNVVKNSSIPLHEVIKAASLNPATMLGINDTVGSLKKGKCADIVIADTDFNIIRVFKDGK